MRIGHFLKNVMTEQNQLIKQGPVYDRIVQSVSKNVNIGNVPNDFVKLEPMT